MPSMTWTPDAKAAEIAKLHAEGRDCEARALETLARVPLLDSLPLDVLRRLAFRAENVVFPAGTEVVREGDIDGVGLFLVVAGEGSVRVWDREVGTVGAGDHF